MTCYLFDNTFCFYGHKNAQVGSGFSCNQLASWIQIRITYPRFRIRKKSLQVRTTKIVNIYYDKPIQTLPAVLYGPLDVKLTRQHIKETWLLQHRTTTLPNIST
jgi:hypothetical protein